LSEDQIWYKWCNAFFHGRRASCVGALDYLQQDDRERQYWRCTDYPIHPSQKIIMVYYRFSVSLTRNGIARVIQLILVGSTRVLLCAWNRFFTAWKDLGHTQEL
jgi:hypothetical protein